jgi:hypothetical protein
MFDPDAHMPRINRGMVYLGACLIAGIRLARERQVNVRVVPTGNAIEESVDLVYEASPQVSQVQSSPCVALRDFVHSPSRRCSIAVRARSLKPSIIGTPKSNNISTPLQMEVVQAPTAPVNVWS